MAWNSHTRQVLLHSASGSPMTTLRSARCRAHSSALDATMESLLIGRRLALTSIGSVLALQPTGAGANVLEEYIEKSQRPEMTPEQAVVKLLDARGVLCELKSLAATAPDSKERFRSRAFLPGMAKRLRQVGQAAPVLVTQVTGSDKRASISKEYGGQGDEAAIAVPVYQAIGQVITISGRTIRKEAQASPEFAKNAIEKISQLLDMLPKEELERAQELRQARKVGGQIESKSIPSNAVVA